MPARAQRLGPLLITLAAFAVRAWALLAVPARWDEGWSAAHAAQSIPDILWITGADVHPPLYYLLLWAWQQMLGVNLFSNRWLSVLMAIPAIPLAWQAARIWFGRRSAPWAALVMAWLPLHVYYAQVVRMYALVPTFILLVLVGAGAIIHPRQAVGARHASPLPLTLVFGAAGAMLTLYHSAWALLAIGIVCGVILLARHDTRGLRAFALASGAALLVFAPWGLYAIPRLLARAAGESTRNTNSATPITTLLETGLLDLTFSQLAGWPGVLLLGLLVLAGVWLGRRRALVASALMALSIGLTLLCVALAARNWAFNARMLVAAAPALALLLGAALAALPAVARVLAIIAVISMYFNTSTQFVYAKTLEVFGDYNPHQYFARIAGRDDTPGRAGDAVVVNVLSLGGFFLYDAAPSQPALSYALTWDPVIEPRAQWEPRMQALAQRHPRIWLLLYNGIFANNGPLRGYMDSNLFPALGEWGEESTFFGLYGVPPAQWAPTLAPNTRWGGLSLAQAQCPTRAAPDAIVPIALGWRADAALTHTHKIFVHALAPDGRLIAQHDAMPLNDLRPFNALPIGELVRDHHGLALREPVASVQIMVGLYDPTSGQRVRTDDGRDGVALCSVPLN